MEHVEMLKSENAEASPEELLDRFGSNPFPFLLFLDPKKLHEKQDVHEKVSSLRVVVIFYKACATN